MPGTEQESIASRLDTTVAHAARRYDYWLGGKDNFAADRESGDAVAAAFPTIRLAVRENRSFLRRAVRFLAEEASIRQFLDVGTGLPTANNTHQVAQAIAPGSRIAYVDNDPMVLVHARALLTSTPEGATTYVDADLREPAKILGDPELRQTLDFEQPVALMLVAVMHFILDEDDPYAVVGELVEALPPGSYLAVAQATYDPLPPATVAALEAANARGNPKSRPRSRAEFARFFDGLELVTPGIVSVAEWRAEDEPQPRPSFEDISGYAAVARVP
ncbi:SAM-dependent methyltransferase [Actinoplanes sp. TBRC 11911]|uniref:SAM-dependent methyltransferase n=1 Tax=Actinoplanes sp. TBRC 11911 TaxID=2729386 RepID=UPI00145F3B93|nr:SAM-dependent methyltransferase [Actinoplanes sp. TBRC 11911]NMO55456.1 SAM-dependent methyltransferase [Actinoplanes sp. TBRC 11911]